MRLSALLLLAGVLGAAETKPTPVPPPHPGPAPIAIDPATARKAEAAADAYLKQAATPVDPTAETVLAEIEIHLLEVHAFLEAKQPLKAGEHYLAAIEKRKVIDDVQGPLLGKRLRKADADLLALSRVLLGQAAFDLGDPPAAPAEPAAK